MSQAARRPATVAALLVTAVAGGAAAGVLAACFIWLVEEGTELVWVDLPEKVGVAPFGSWWLFAVPIVGGAAVGLGQRFLGNHPVPIDKAVTTWRSGGHIDPASTPKTFANSLVALVAGGPVGFEAALTGLLGGTATWIGRRIGAAGHLVRQAWGAERIEAVPHTVRTLPYWLAAVGGLLAYRWLPFGAIDLGFRFEEFDGDLGVIDALVVFGFAAAVTVPAAWAVRVVVRAEEATAFTRSPVLIGMAGGAVFATLAVGNELVLFSGQQGIQQLPDTDTATLLYLLGAKWLALVIALVAGWRGGPIFPMFFAIAALAVAVDEIAQVGPDLVIVAGIAAMATVFLRGSVPLAFVLTLYVAPLSYAVVILVACVASATALTLARPLGLLPSARGPHHPHARHRQQAGADGLT